MAVKGCILKIGTEAIPVLLLLFPVADTAARILIPILKSIAQFCIHLVVRAAVLIVIIGFTVEISDAAVVKSTELEEGAFAHWLCIAYAEPITLCEAV